MTNNHGILNILGQSLLALTIGSAIGYAQVPASVPVPISYQRWLQLQADPVAMSSLRSHPAPAVERVAGGIVVGPWKSVNPLPTPGMSPANPLLMTDGTLIVHLINDSVFQGTQNWMQLTPDINGKYDTGTWAQFASLPAGYGPIFFGSAILPDGRVIINGGEYNDNDNGGDAVRTTRGAIYYPSLGAWTSVAPPAGWTMIGDAQTVVLNDGTYMLADCCDTPPRAALFRGTPPFNSAAWTATGTGKFDVYDEEGWTLLPSGDVLTVDAYVFIGCDTNSERYLDATGNWVTAGSTIRQLPDCSGNRSLELGPAVLRPDGTIIAFGGTTTGTAHTAIFNSSTLTWAAGPDIPSVGSTPYTLADAPAALLPSGNVLFAASPSNWPAATGPGAFPPPTNFFEVGPNSAGNVITQVTQNPDGPSTNSFEWNFLLLPTGEILAVETYAPNVWIYTPAGLPNPSWAPVINTSPTDVSRASTYKLSGMQFNGLSQGVAYGDDVQASTNYPIVKIVNNATGHVFYERTFGFSTMSVAPNTASSTNFMVSGKTETGPSQLFVIANGISSTGVPVTVH
jgi:hypothetical protein